MTLTNAQLAAQDYRSQPVQGVADNTVEVVKALERQFQTQPAITSEQVQACQLEPGDRVLYKDRVMRVGSKPSTTRRWGFFVSLLPANYCNPYTDYKRWQAHFKQHRLEIPSNWFTPWQRVKPELETVELPYNPFGTELQGNTIAVKVPLVFNEPAEDGIQSEPEAVETITPNELKVGDWVKYPSQFDSEWLEVQTEPVMKDNRVFLQLRRLGLTNETYPWMGDCRWRFLRQWFPKFDLESGEF